MFVTSLVSNVFIAEFTDWGIILTLHPLVFVVLDLCKKNPNRIVLNDNILITSQGFKLVYSKSKFAMENQYLFKLQKIGKYSGNPELWEIFPC